MNNLNKDPEKKPGFLGGFGLIIVIIITSVVLVVGLKLLIG